MADQRDLSRDLEAARKAYKDGDVEASQMAHLAQRHAHSETKHHKKSGGVISSLVFGGLDGITTTFAVLVAAAAGHLPIWSLLIITLANLVGDAVGMAVGDYLGSVAEGELEEKQVSEEREKIRTQPEKQKAFMLKTYMDMGMSPDSARELVELLVESEEGFLKSVCVHKDIGVGGDDDGPGPIVSALVTFCAFLVLGGIPTLGYALCFNYKQNASIDGIFWASMGLFFVTLFILGAVKGVITNVPWWKSGLGITIQGGITTTAAFAIGYGFDQISDK